MPSPSALFEIQIPEDMVDLLMSAMRCAAEEVECRSPPGKVSVFAWAQAIPAFGR